jgi:hypothetical protein
VTVLEVSPVLPQRRFLTLPLSALGFFLAEVWASPNPGRLAAITGRIEFVILRTGSSLPVAPHPVSRRRNNSSLQAGERMPKEDFHPSNQVHFQAHMTAFPQHVKPVPFEPEGFSAAC